MKCLVPIARASRYDCERLAEEIAHSQFSTQEVAILFAAWRNGLPCVRQRVIGDPKLFLRARREIEQEDPVSVRAGEELLRNLDMVGAIARRAALQWHAAAGTMDDAERENAWLCLQQAIADLARLSDKIEKENGYVESEPTDSNPGASSQGCGQASNCTSAASFAAGNQQSDPLAIDRAAAHRPCRKSGATSAGDHGTVRFLPGESGPGP
jgi:hypothetical protein